MPSVTIGYTFVDGERIGVTVEPDGSYPDALDQAMSEALRGFAEAAAVMFALNVADEDE